MLAFGAVVALDWLWRDHEGVATPAEGRRTLLRAGIACAVAVAVMLAGYRRWPVQGLGLLGTLIGFAGLCVRVLARWGPQPVTEPERDLIHAFLDVGPPTLVLGLAIWIVSRRADGAGGEPQPEIPTIERDEHSGVIYEREDRR